MTSTREYRFLGIQCGLALSDIQDQIWLRIHCREDIKTKSLFPLSPPSSQLWVMKAYEAEYDFRTSRVVKEIKETCTGVVTSTATAAGLRPLQSSCCCLVPETHSYTGAPADLWETCKNARWLIYCGFRGDPRESKSLGPGWKPHPLS